MTWLAAAIGLRPAVVATGIWYPLATAADRSRALHSVSPAARRFQVQSISPIRVSHFEEIVVNL
jgi:hypothetical protein